MDVDLAGQTKPGTEKLIPPAWCQKIEIDIGLPQNAARKKLNDASLDLTIAEIQALTDIMLKNRINSIINLYHTKTEGVTFDNSR